MRPRWSLIPVALLGCTPEPASSQEILQTVQELVDQGRAIALENAAVAWVADVDPDGEPLALRDDVAARLAADIPCAVIAAAADEPRFILDFEVDCTIRGRSYTGGLTVTYARPSPDSLLVTVEFDDLASAGSTLGGTSRITWGVDATRRVVSELRLDSAAPGSETPGRQIEVQSDRIQRSTMGHLQIDGWRRWQTLMGKWEAELGGWELASEDLLPTRGLTSVDTPFEHDIYVDHEAAGDGTIEVRANGGRRDFVFMVAADGSITELGED